MGISRRTFIASVGGVAAGGMAEPNLAVGLAATPLGQPSGPAGFDLSRLGGRVNADPEFRHRLHACRSP